MVSEEESSWTCPVCTLVNNAKKRRCDACKSRMPFAKPSNNPDANNPDTDLRALDAQTKEEDETISGATRRTRRSARRTSPNSDNQDRKQSRDDVDQKMAKKPSKATPTPSAHPKDSQDGTNTPKEETAHKEAIPASNETLEHPTEIPSSLVYRHVIAGWYEEGENSKSGENTLYPVINPATNQPSLYYHETSGEALEHAIQQACKIQEELYSCNSSCVGDASSAAWWPDPHQSHRRAGILTAIADLLQTNTDRLADLEVTQIGRPRKEMRFQLSRLHEWFRYYAGLLRSGGESCPPFGKDHLNVVRRVPLGVVAQITPFNHPLLIAVKKLAPALAAGNCVVLKPSEKAPASVVELAHLCKKAGLPDGVLSVVLGGKDVGVSLVSDPRIRKVDFTGGPVAGAAIGNLAGKNIGKMTQELGGKAPMIVFAPKDMRGTLSMDSQSNRNKRSRRTSSSESGVSGDDTEMDDRAAQQEALDAYLDPIVNGCSFGAFIASGQTCIAGTRLLVQKEIYSLVCEKLTHKIQNVILKEGMGDPFAMTTTFGPMIQKEQMDFVHSVVTSCVSSSGKDKKNHRLELLCGGKRYQGFKDEEAHLNNGNWYEPTLIAFRYNNSDDDEIEEKQRQIVSDLHHDCSLFQQELFAPVLGILPFQDEQHAIQLANDSPFSLGCSIWTHDLAQAHFVAERVRAGIVWINDHHKNAPSSPWGGLTKESGIGVENGTEALMDYSQSKSLVIRTTPYKDDWFQDPNARYN